MPCSEFSGKIDRTPILPTSKLERALEPDVRFRGAKADLPGLAVAEMTRATRRGRCTLCPGRGVAQGVATEQRKTPPGSGNLEAFQGDDGLVGRLGDG
jgi:hypothetical protein